ncbi:MAG: biotin transporter BioY [Methanomicrobiales archaeon]|nr:biotin transporter BioY [Methanomicrobiales archaeon]NYT20273.1 biotin transporter BioY [Methanomicrobiales archaeon]
MLGDSGRPVLIASTAAFTGLIAIGSWIAIPFVPVPLTLQTLFVILSGAVMGRYAVLPNGLYILMGALNVPVFHSGTAGLAVLLGPTGGYIIGFVPGALVTGLAYEQRNTLIRIAGIIFGLGVIFLCGMSWLSVSAGISLSTAFLVGVLPFLPGDAVKGYAIFLIAGRLEALASRSGDA